MKNIPMLEWTPERVARFWDYESQFPQNYFSNLFGHIIIGRVERYLRSAGTVLDYGCGTGYMTKHLLDKGYRVTGLDFSRDSLAGVAKKFQGLENFDGAFLADELLAKGKKFEAIVVFEVIEHLSDEYLEATAANLKSLLAPGGVVVMTTPNQEKLEDSHIFCPACVQVFHRWQHVRSWDSKTLSAFLEGKGFRVQKTFTTDFSISFGRRFRSAFKYQARKALGLAVPDPHLVCVFSFPA